MTEQEGLFEAAEAKPAPYKHKPRMPPGRVRWAAMANLSNVPCDDCKALQVENPAAPLALRARWKRVQGGRDRWLCSAHAQDWRAADGHAGLPVLPTPPRGTS